MFAHGEGKHCKSIAEMAENGSPALWDGELRP
jgi:hypothetical protein